MSFCDVGDGDDGWELVLDTHIETDVDAECNVCGDTIPAGDAFRQLKWDTGEDEEVERSMCAMCEDAFHDSEMPVYDSPADQEDAMVGRLDQLDDKEILEEYASWMAKHEAYRAWFNAHWPEVEETLLQYVQEYQLRECGGKP